MTRTSAFRRASAATLIAAAVFAGTAGVSAAAAAVATTASTSSSSTVIAGRSATLTITLRSGTTGAIIPGVVVKLWSRPSSSAAWTFVASATTSSSGVASVVVKPLHNTQYEWTFAGNSQFQPVTSGVVTLLVAQAISITANHPSATTLNVWGGVTPNETGQIVVLQRLINGVWTSLGSGAVIKSQTLPNGVTATSYLFHLGGLTLHSYVLRATRAATATNVAGVSATLTVSF
ncbi:MAG TPA: hypothetical protein VGN35_01845 [Jatrophihabitantaceae bacterium]|jgi:hypothetical protein|nr:hypothetical protein [Jatrophihabitantaceae bacterium]